MKKRPQKKSKVSKYTPKDLAILKNYDPELSAFQNLDKLENNGQTSVAYGYRRLKKNQYLQQDIELIKAHHREFLVREAMPKANNLIMKKLKAEEFPAVKLVYDKYYGQEQPQAGSNTWINIMTGKCEIQTYGAARKVGEDEDK